MHVRGQTRRTAYARRYREDSGRVKHTDQRIKKCVYKGNCESTSKSQARSSYEQRSYTKQDFLLRVLSFCFREFKPRKEHFFLSFFWIHASFRSLKRHVGCCARGALRGVSAVFTKSSAHTRVCNKPRHLHRTSRSSSWRVCVSKKHVFLLLFQPTHLVFEDLLDTKAAQHGPALLCAQTEG